MVRHGISPHPDTGKRGLARTPAQHLVTIEEIGRIAAVLASEAGMTLTGSTVYTDAGFHVVA
ncbi:SDR family oxidoreductase [Paraburkholderia sp. SIMBA_030]|uniref:SDR family oxidoreductase n=1 Tax=Paraburkholderia sp. SIMBA_030 TaxID=3085773 RepID=UPI00397915D9